MISVTKLLVKILEQFKYDYVIAHGVENGWYYNKWHSGFCECWKTVDFTGTASSSWGNLYISTAIPVDNFPNNLFRTNPPKVTVSARCNDTGYQSTARHSASSVTTTSFGSVNIVRTVKTTSSHSYTISLYACKQHNALD